LNRRSGFTLVELLLGFLIFSFIASGLYGTFRACLTVSRRAQETNTGYRELRWILDQIALDLTNAVEYDFSGSYPNLKAMDGAPNHIRMIVVGKDGLQAVNYDLKDPEAQKVTTTIVHRNLKRAEPTVMVKDQTGPTKILMRTQQPLADFLNHADSKNQEVLSFLVRDNGLKFSYAPTQAATSESIAWTLSWDKDSLPSLVRMDLDLVNRQAGQPDLKVSRDFWIPAGH
jgi:type II secretory pathway component PulJ